MPAKLTLKVFQEKAAERGGKCLSLEYKKITEKLTFQCAEKHIWEAAGCNMLHKGQWCPRCAGNSPLTIEDAKKTAEERGGRCLSTEYLNNSTPLKFECSLGHRWESCMVSVKNNGHWCPRCAGKASPSLGDIQKTAEKMGGRCLSTEYRNNRQRLEFECSLGHRWLTTADNLLNAKTWCPFCARNAPLSLDVFQNIANKNGGKCLSAAYAPQEKLEFECSEGHRWFAAGGAVKNAKQWCPCCAAGRGERNALDSISSISGLVFRKIRPKWLPSSRGGRMEIDGYCERAGLAIEYQGRQHYEYIPEFFHQNGPEDFESQLERDRLKAELVARHNILLLAIPASPRPSPASVRAAVRKAAEDACFPLLGVNREFTRMCVLMGRPPMHRFAACLPYAAFRACCGE